MFEEYSAVKWHKWPEEIPDKKYERYLVFTKDGKTIVRNFFGGHEFPNGETIEASFGATNRKNVIAWAKMPPAPTWFNNNKEEIRKLEKKIANLQAKLEKLKKEES